MPLINMLFKGGGVFILNPRENLFPGLPVSRVLRWEQVGQFAGDWPTWVLPKHALWLIAWLIVGVFAGRSSPKSMQVNEKND